MKKILLIFALLSSLGFSENNEITIRGGLSGTNFDKNNKTFFIY